MSGSVVDLTSAGHVVKTNNDDATTISDIRNGASGQLLTVVAGDGHTTVNNNHHLSLHGGADWKMTPGDTLTLLFDPPVWREVSRANVP